MSLKEINDLIERTENVQKKFSNTGKGNKLADDSWGGRRDRIFRSLKAVQDLFDSYDDAKKNDQKELPKIKSKIRSAHGIIKELLERMKQEFEKKVKKAHRKKNPTPEIKDEIERMKEDLVDLNETYTKSEGEYEAKLGLSLSKRLNSGSAGVSSMHIELTNFMAESSGGMPAPDKSFDYNDDYDELDSYAKQALAQVDKSKQEMDERLDQLEELMPQIQEIARTINEELEVQDTMIDEALKNVTKADDKLKKVEGQVNDSLKEQKAQNHFCYIIGCIVLLALLGVMYNLVKGSE
jgi:flagellar capping protein FliD